MARISVEVPDELAEYVEWLRQYRGYRSIELAYVEVLKAGKSRVEQLRRYAEKRKNPEATFRPYAPLKASEKLRGDTKRGAAAEGVATVRDPMPWRCTKLNSLGQRCVLPVLHVADAESSVHEFP